MGEGRSSERKRLGGEQEKGQRLYESCRPRRNEGKEEKRNTEGAWAQGRERRTQLHIHSHTHIQVYTVMHTNGCTHVVTWPQSCPCICTVTHMHTHHYTPRTGRRGAGRHRLSLSQEGLLLRPRYYPKPQAAAWQLRSHHYRLPPPPAVCPGPKDARWWCPPGPRP